MSITNKTDVYAELDAVCKALAAGQRSDPETQRIAAERMDREREELRQKIGTVNVAVELIRDARNQ